MSMVGDNLRMLADEVDQMQMATVRAAERIAEVHKNITNDTRLLNILEGECRRTGKHFLVLLSEQWTSDIRSTLRRIADNVPKRDHEPTPLALPEDFEGLLGGDDHRQTQSQEQRTQESVSEQRVRGDLRPGLLTDQAGESSPSVRRIDCEAIDGPRVGRD